MKIWILTSETPHFWAGGIARYLHNFALLLAKSGHEVRVVSRGEKDGVEETAPGYFTHTFVTRHERAMEPSDAEEPDEHPGFPYNNQHYWAALGMQYVEVLREMVKTLGAPDVIESQDYMAIAYFALQRKWLDDDFLRETPLVLHLHTPHFVVGRINEDPRFKLPDYWIGQMEKAAILAADAVLSPSRFIAREVSKEIEGELPPQTTIPYPWPELETDESTPPLIREPAGEEGPTLVYFGRIELRKGVEPLLKACDALWESGSKFRLHMIGGDVLAPSKGGSTLDFLARRYRRHVNRGRLSFFGALPHPQALVQVRKADAVVIPSLWENFPNTCIEAMRMGKTIVASRSGGQAEMIGEDGDCGVLFDHALPGDLEHALRRVLAMSPEDRMTMGDAAAARIADLCSPERVLEQRLAHFREVIEAAKRRDPSLFPFQNELQRSGRVNERIAPVASEKGMVTAVIPYFNLGRFLPDAVESIVASDYENFEVLIINDGSTDKESIEVLDTYRGDDWPKVRVLDIPNGGLANARNVGAAEARGEYVAFVDADDCIEPAFLGRAAATFNRYSNVHVVYSWVRYFGAKKGIWSAWNLEFPYLLAHNMMIPICVVRKDAFLAFGQNKPHIRYGLEDYEGWISMVAEGCGGVALQDILVRYRIREGSMFQVIERNKQLLLYDWIVREHPEVYQKYGDTLFSLQNANGPAHTWDQPTAWGAPYDIALRRLRDQLRSVEDQMWSRTAERDKLWHKGERLSDENRKLKESLEAVRTQLNEFEARAREAAPEPAPRPPEKPSIWKRWLGGR